MASNTERLQYLCDFRKLFLGKPGSEGIATLPSLVVLDSLLSTYPILTVLEIGRGIGTLTLFMGTNYDVTISSIESNEYCILESEKNCAEIDFRAFKLFEELSTHDLEEFDLIVFAGPVSNSDFKLLFLGLGVRIYFFENHQVITKVRVLHALFWRGRMSRYVEIFPTHTFEGPSYIVSSPRYSSASFLMTYLALFILILPRVLRHSVSKLAKRQNPLADSYLYSKWNPKSRK